MSYSGLAKAVLLSVALSACAHAAPTYTAANTGAVPTENVAVHGAEGPRVQRLHSAFLATEGHPAETTGGAVFVEHNNCDVWAREASARCDVAQLVSESIAPGTQSTHW